MKNTSATLNELNIDSDKKLAEYKITMEKYIKENNKKRENEEAWLKEKERVLEEIKFVEKSFNEKLKKVA